MNGSSGKGESLTRRHCSQYHTPNPLIQAPKESPVHLPTHFVYIKLFIVWALDPSLYGVKGVDEKVHGECCKGTGLVGPWSASGTEVGAKEGSSTKRTSMCVF